MSSYVRGFACGRRVAHGITLDHSSTNSNELQLFEFSRVCEYFLALNAKCVVERHCWQTASKFRSLGAHFSVPRPTQTKFIQERLEKFALYA